MSKFFFILCICFFTHERDTEANTCNTQQLGPQQPLLITLFDKNYEADNGLWDNLCKVIKQFPRGLITMEYRPGALAAGTIQSIKCGSGNCRIDQYHGCELFHYQYINDCYYPGVGGSASLIATILCYCNQESNKLLLDNSGLRASWNIPENAIPALAFNGKYDSCAKTMTYEDIKNYVCQLYQKKVGPCS